MVKKECYHYGWKFDLKFCLAKPRTCYESRIGDGAAPVDRTEIEKRRPLSLK